MGWLRLVGSLKLQVSFAKDPYEKDYILQKRPIILRSLLIVATPYRSSTEKCSHFPQKDLYTFHRKICTFSTGMHPFHTKICTLSSERYVHFLSSERYVHFPQKNINTFHINILTLSTETCVHFPRKHM